MPRIDIGEITVKGLHFRYLGYGKVKLTLDIKTGEKVSYIISTRTMVGTADQAVSLFKNNPRAMLHEMDALCAQD